MRTQRIGGIAAPRARATTRDTAHVPNTARAARDADRDVTVAVDRCTQALEVLHELVKELRRWVTGRELGAAWPRILKEPLPADVKGRWTRAFGRALDDGRVLTRRDGLQQVYAPGAGAHTLAASPSSDLGRIETALARVVARVGGAVPVEAIEEEVDGDDALTMRTDTSVASRVIRLAAERRIQRMHAPGSTAGRWYYAPNGSAVSIATDTELVIDRRMRAIRALWRLSEGRPFTTRAVSVYAKDRDTFVIADDTPYGWTNALQHLAKQGFLTRLDVAGSDWHVRWALTKEWEVLSAAEQRLRLADPYGRDICDALITPLHALDASDASDARPRGADEGFVRSGRASSDPLPAYHTLPTLATPLVPHLPGVRIDVSGVSRARDVAALAAMAQAQWGEWATQQPDPILRAHGAERPVTLEEIAEQRRAHPLLLPAKQPLLASLHEATRVREEMQAAAVTDMGTVRNTSYFAVRATGATRAFVAVQRALADANLPWLQRVLANLHSDRGYSDGGVIPVPTSLLLARAAELLAESEEIARHLHEALPQAPLTCEERDEADRTLHALQTVAADARAMLPAAERGAPHTAAGAHRPPENMWLDVAVAEQQFRGLVTYKMENPRALWARIVNAVRVLRSPHDRATSSTERQPATRTCGRQVSNYLDRVGFSLWVARRIGGPLVAGMAAQALAIIGESRPVALVIDALRDPAQKPAHTGLCAALGFFDDDVSRDALTAYLEQAVAETPAARVGDTSARKGAVVGAGEEAGATGGSGSGGEGPGGDTTVGDATDASADEAWDAPVWRTAPVDAGALPPSTSGNAVATAVFGLGRTPCGGLATTLGARERAALEAVRDQSTIRYARDAARQVLRGWDSNWTREQWLAI